MNTLYKKIELNEININKLRRIFIITVLFSFLTTLRAEDIKNYIVTGSDVTKIETFELANKT